MAKKQKMETSIALPQGVTATVSEGTITIKGPKGQTLKKYQNSRLDVEVKDNSVIIIGKKGNKRDKTLMNTTKAHVKNMVRGCTQPYKYALKVCSGHFPMSVSVTKEEFIVKNFFGEKLPRKLKLKKGVEVKVEGDIITIEGIDKELCGQMASDIEKLTKRSSYDRRVFQDGIYITRKDDKELK